MIYLGDKERLMKSSFDPNRATKIITHGYVSSRDSLSCTMPRDGKLNFLFPGINIHIGLEHSCGTDNDYISGICLQPF